MTGENLQLILVFVLLAAVFVAFAKEWCPPDLVALSALAILIVTGTISEKDVASIFSNNAPLTIGAMFVLSAALTRTGTIERIARLFTRVAGKSEIKAIVLLALIVIPLSAAMNNTPIVVVFLPIVLAHARAMGLRASKLLIPLSFASILGGTCTLTGTSTSLIVDGIAQEYGQKAFGMFEVTSLGLVYLAVGFVYIITIGRKLLPSRSSLSELIDPDLTREVLTQFQVEPGSPLVGKTLVESLLKTYPLARVLEVRRRGRSLDVPIDQLVIFEKDRLLLVLHGKAFKELRKDPGVSFEGQNDLSLTQVETRELKLLEGIIGPRSHLVGKTLKEIGFRRNFGINVLAIHRQGVNLHDSLNKVRLAFGDTLFMEGEPDTFKRLQEQKDFVSISETPDLVVDKKKVWLGVGITMAFVLGAAFSVLPIPALAILAALTMILTRCVTPHQCYDAIQWNIVFLIFGMLALGLAMDQSGAAQVLVDGIMALAGDFSPFIILAIVYLLSSTLTELISNNAVAALLTPIVIGIAEKISWQGEIGVDARPFIVALIFGCSASFATPIGYQTNTYVYGAGGYKFTDFPRIGVPLNLVLWVVASFLIPVIWPFR